MTLQARLQEFRHNVWDHSQDTFQASFDQRPPLSDDEIENLTLLIGASANDDEDVFLAVLQKLILARGEELLFVLLQLCGLTRSKIIGDLKASATVKENKVTISASHMKLVRENSGWKYAGPYLALRIRPIFKYLAEYKDPSAALQALNLGTWPGFIRQERAKRQGHEAEGRLAQLLKALDIPFEPEQKAENPLCADATIYSVSFDLVVPSVARPAICIKSTVHTSNIGQYGESKDHLEVDEARRMIDKEFKTQRPLLLALIDGIGFNSNAAGLNGVLSKSDEFCQFKTLWKAVVLAANACGKSLTLRLPEESMGAHAEFLKRRNHGAVTVKRLQPEQLYEKGVRAGEGIFLHR